MLCITSIDLSNLLPLFIIYEYNKISRQNVVKQTLLTISVTKIEVKNPSEFCSHCKINKGL